MAANTWETIGTGHTSFFGALGYIRAIEAQKVLLVHLSGHEDEDGSSGRGWTDSQWETKAREYCRDNSINVDIGIGRQGMLIGI